MWDDKETQDCLVSNFPSNIIFIDTPENQLMKSSNTCLVTVSSTYFLTSEFWVEGLLKVSEDLG